MKNKIHSLIVEGVLFCGSGLGLLSYSLLSYEKSFNKNWAQSPYLFPLLVGLAMTGLSIWLIGEGVQASGKEAAYADGRRAAGAGNTESGNTEAGNTESENAEETNTEAANTRKEIFVGQISGVMVALVLCGIYYLLLANLRIPYVTIGIFSFMYTFSTFEVATVVFLAAMMAFMGVRRLPVLFLVPLGTTLFLSIAFRTLLHVLLP